MELDERCEVRGWELIPTKKGMANLHTDTRPGLLKIAYALKLHTVSACTGQLSAALAHGRIIIAMENGATHGRRRERIITKN